MKTFRDIELFHQAAHAGSLSEAARRMDLTPAAASMALKRLEQELGIPLFLRSTRSLRLTEEGRIYLEHSQQAMQLLKEGQEAAQGGSSTLRGILHLSAPSDLGRNILSPWLDEFQEQHPELQLRLQLSDSLADVYRQPLDLALRYGPLPDSSLVALPITSQNRRILCASPDYLARRGTPQTPLDLVGHNCLCFMLNNTVHDRWHFLSGKEEITVQVSGNRTADDGDAVRRWALAGKGITYKSALDVAEDLISGRLRRFCENWQGEYAPLNLVCASRRTISPVIKALRQFLIQKCSGLINGIPP